MPSFSSIDDAEKGHADEIYSVDSHDSAPTLVYHEAQKKSLGQANFATIQLALPSKELSAKELALIRGPTKKPASSWVKFRLWYNAYKCVSYHTAYAFSHGCAQTFLHDRFPIQLHLIVVRGNWPLAVPEGLHRRVDFGEPAFRHTRANGAVWPYPVRRPQCRVRQGTWCPSCFPHVFNG